MHHSLTMTDHISSPYYNGRSRSLRVGLQNCFREYARPACRILKRNRDQSRMDCHMFNEHQVPRVSE